MSSLIRKAIEAAVDGALGEVARQAGPSRMLAEARTAGLLAADPFARALSAPPPDAEIERLVDALIRDAYAEGWEAANDEGGNDKPSAKATRETNAARSALLAAIRVQVPADLAGLLREMSVSGAVKVGGLSVDENVAAQDRWNTAIDAVASWTRANLKETP